MEKDQKAYKELQVRFEDPKAEDGFVEDVALLAYDRYEELIRSETEIKVILSLHRRNLPHDVIGNVIGAISDMRLVREMEAYNRNAQQ